MKKTILIFSILLLLLNKYAKCQIICDNKVSAIVIDANNRKLFGTANGLIIYDGIKWSQQLLPKSMNASSVSSIAVDKDNNIWVGSYDDFCTSLIKFKGDTFISYQAKDGLTDTHIYAIYIDSKGFIWLGTREGVMKYDGKNWTNYSQTNGLVNNKVRCIAEDLPGNMWFGTNQGASKFDGTNWTTYTSSNGLLVESIASIAVDAQNNIWFAHDCLDCGVSKYDGKNWKTYKAKDGLAANEVSSIAFDSKGSIYFATLNGLSKFDNSNWTTFTKKDGIIDDGINKVYVDNDNRIWLGSLSGISKYDSAKWTNYNCDNFALSVTNPIENSFSNQIELFPNPTHDILNIELKEKINEATIKVFSSQGFLILEKAMNYPSTKINLESLDAGIYLVSISNSESNIYKKIVKQ